jgi:D-methionine transport system permease protein
MLLDKFLTAFGQTVAMVSASFAIAFIVGLGLALTLVVTGRGGVYPSNIINRLLAVIINGFRSTPFIILLVVLLPVTRSVVGTSIGVKAAIVPLSISMVPFFARIAEVSLRDIDRGLIEAAQAMGCRGRHIVRHVLLPEAMPGIIRGATVTVVAMIGASAMAGAVGAGGLGDLAIRYGYERYDLNVMLYVIALLILLVNLVQFSGDFLARRADHRH